MTALRRIVLVRHGETVGQSSVRFHGSADVELSDEGRQQLRASARALRGETFDLVVASNLWRSWEGASIVAGGAVARLEPRFREIDFGRWEGLTAEEIEASDPVLYQDWQSNRGGSFEFPDGEPRADFRDRVQSGLDALLESDAASVLHVGHKGVIRTIGGTLVGDPITSEIALGGIVTLSRGADGKWREGTRGSNPPGLG